eukprot:TRINITY_DN12519_c0_g1_i1.p1 TRINITY_DN12519_c0_g1~~TRINITY_DN12519_c0_g1_i1.p1  ORF type:complete len:209 (-),score=42.52 TRINITY_DN12519_c0_g1_i1:10-558(-)
MKRKREPTDTAKKTETKKQKKLVNGKKKKVFKRIFDSPFLISWNISEHKDEIIVLLSNVLFENQHLDRAHGVYVGINSVTKAIEKDLLDVVVVAKETEPSILVQHFPTMCYLKGVKLCPLPMGSEEMGRLFDLPSVAAFGFKKLENEFKDVTETLMRFSPELNIPWLSKEISYSDEGILKLQ